MTKVTSEKTPQPEPPGREGRKGGTTLLTNRLAVQSLKYETKVNTNCATICAPRSLHDQMLDNCRGHPNTHIGTQIQR